MPQPLPKRSASASEEEGIMELRIHSRKYMTCLKVNSIKLYETLSGGKKTTVVKLKTVLQSGKLLKHFSSEILGIACSSIFLSS